MRPGDRTIRDELRREAANAPIPEDMWQNISLRLDEDEVRRKQKHLARSEQWRPALVLAVAAGFFWFALIPALPGTRSILPGEASSGYSAGQLYPAFGSEFGQTQSDYLSTRRPSQPTAFADEERSFHAVPQ